MLDNGTFDQGTFDSLFPLSGQSAATVALFSTFETPRPPRRNQNDWIAFSDIIISSAVSPYLATFTVFEVGKKPANLAKTWTDFAGNPSIEYPHYPVFSGFDPARGRKNLIQEFTSFIPAPAVHVLGEFSPFDPALKPKNFSLGWIEFYQQTTAAQITSPPISFSPFDQARHSKNFAEGWTAFPSNLFQPTQTPGPLPYFLEFSRPPLLKPWTPGQQPQWWTYQFTFPPPPKRDTHDSGDYIPRWHRQTPRVYEQEYYDELNRLKYPPQPQEEIPLVRPPPQPNLLIPVGKLIAGVPVATFHTSPPHRPVPSLTTNPPPFRMATKDEMASDDEMIIRMLLEE